MPRLYKRDVRFPTFLVFPDWTFIEKVEALLRQYEIPEDRGGQFEFSGKDSRGTFSASDLDSFKRQVEEEEQPLLAMTVGLGGREESETYRTVFVWTKDQDFLHSSHGATIESGDEAIVNHLAVRLEELAARAVERQEEKRANAASTPAPTATAAAAPDRGWVYNPWVIAIGSGVILVVLGVVLTVWLS